MRTSTTKYITRVGLCAMALVLAAALVLAGCGNKGDGAWEGPMEVKKFDPKEWLNEETIQKIEELKSKPAGTYRLQVTGKIEHKSLVNSSYRAIEELLGELPAGVLVELDLSGIQASSSDTIRSLHGCKNLAKVILPSIVTTIGISAFYNCTNLKEIEGLENVTEIGDNAFNNCSSLTNVRLSKNLKIIESATFKDCTSLKEITLPNSVNTIKREAFLGCTSLQKLLAEGEVTTSGGEGIDEIAFQDCSSLAEVTIPASVTSIESSAFYYSKDLTSVIFADSTSTWTVTPTSSYGNRQTQTGITVTDPSLNASYLKDHLWYCFHNWTKEKI